MMLAGRKRKSSEDSDDQQYGRYNPSSPYGDHDQADTRMSASPTHSPSMASRTIQTPSSSRQIKRMRHSMFGRPLPLPRLLETLDVDAIRDVLRTVVERHPQLASEIESIAPRPTVQSALGVLDNYENGLRGAFPFGGNSGSDYTYNRVKQALLDLLNSLSDFTPYFLPPQESQMATSLTFLDAATDIIHRLPTWDNPMHNHHKQLAYEEISKAWSSVISEATKKGAGIQLEYAGWDTKVANHNRQSGGKMQHAVDEMNACLGLAAPSATPQDAALATGSPLRNELPGKFGSMTVQVGSW